MSISINNLTMSFTSNSVKKTVLSGLDLSIGEAEIFTLFGPNGSGKTTVLKLISGVLVPNSGQIKVSGFDLEKEPSKARARIGVSYDPEKSFYQILSAYDNIRFYSGLFGMDNNYFNERYNMICSKLKLEEYSNTSIAHCSSGIRQKFSLLRAFITNPRVLLLDEPTRSLDKEARSIVVDFIKEEALRNQITCLIVTHDKEDTEFFSAKTGYMENGRIIY